VLDPVWLVLVAVEVFVAVEVSMAVEVLVVVGVLVVANFGERVVEWDFSVSDLQRHPHHQCPYHHPLEIAFCLLVAGDHHQAGVDADPSKIVIRLWIFRIGDDLPVVLDQPHYPDDCMIDL
jgi:hypothetical protein